MTAGARAAVVAALLGGCGSEAGVSSRDHRVEVASCKSLFVAMFFGRTPACRETAVLLDGDCKVSDATRELVLHCGADVSSRGMTPAQLATCVDDLLHTECGM